MIRKIQCRYRNNTRSTSLPTETMSTVQPQICWYRNKVRNQNGFNTLATPLVNTFIDLPEVNSVQYSGGQRSLWYCCRQYSCVQRAGSAGAPWYATASSRKAYNDNTCTSVVGTGCHYFNTHSHVAKQLAIELSFSLLTAPLRGQIAQKALYILELDI